MMKLARLPCVISLLLLGLSASSVQPDRPPNIVFILADDLGWAELGSYGNRFHETPHLDRLAREGIRFTHAYAAAPVCSPTRASLLTGQHPARHGILDYLRPDSGQPLSEAHLTLAEVLRARGYATGMVGKWHLSGYRHHGAPRESRATDHGFDQEIGSEIKSVGNGANFWPYHFRDQPMPWVNLATNRLGPNEYLTDRLNLEAIDFIERHQSRPFFLYLSHYAPHTILNGKPALVAKYRQKHRPGRSTREKCYLCEDAGQTGDSLHHWAESHNPHLAAMLESIDEGVGFILEKLDQLRLAENTIVLFTSDNGGEVHVTSNRPLRGGKSQLYEGGLRVPLIIRWPRLIPPATVCDAPTVTMDFYPTLLAAAQIQPDPRQKLDGISLLPRWRHPAGLPSLRAFHWHYPLQKPHFLGGRSSGAIRHGRWKLIEFFDTRDLELYDLAADPGEEKNLAGDHPDQARALLDELRAWRRDRGARTE